MKTIMLCAISSLSSGICKEDCEYCTQNINSKAKIDRFGLKSVDEVLYEASIASKNHALGFCLVTSGAGLDDDKTDEVAKIARAVSDKFNNLMLIACNGIASKEQLKELKNAGVFSYNHNLETSEEFFPSICTTHTWHQRFQTNLNAKEVGLALCCGGIYGLGETQNDRLSFRKSLSELEPFSSPINFFIQNDGLKHKANQLSVDEALQIVRDSKNALPNTHIMVAGGREVILGDRQYEIFDNGASAIVIGDYLTTKGDEASKEILELRKRGFEFASKCH